MDATEVDRRIKAVDREAAGPQQKLLHNRFDECREALKKADTQVQALEEKRASGQERLGELQADLDAASRGLAKAEAAQAAARHALEEAAAALLTDAEKLAAATFTQEVAMPVRTEQVLDALKPLQELQRCLDT